MTSPGDAHVPCHQGEHSGAWIEQFSRRIRSGPIARLSSGYQNFSGLQQRRHMTIAGHAHATRRRREFSGARIVFLRTGNSLASRKQHRSIR